MKKIRISFWMIVLLCCQVSLMAQNRWTINPEGGITWKIDQRIPHEDHIEMSGQKVSTVLRYGVDANGAFILNRSMVWPMLRTIPNNTHASLMRRFAWNVADMIEIDGRSLIEEKVKDITLDGKMTVRSQFQQAKDKSVGLTRILFPSTTQPMFCEKYILRNLSEKAIRVEIPSTTSVIQTDANQGVDGSYKLVATLQGSTSKTLNKGEELTFSAFFIGYKPQEQEITPDIDKELEARQALLDELKSKLVLNTPNATINTMFAFSKIRGSESIYLTKGGFMHGPGGESYYAALWANDQAEYINPFFPYLGYRVGNESALNAYMHFARFMNDKYEPIPSSIIAEGIDIWDGAGDRGDAAMIAYGASRYALVRGDKAEAEQLWPLIEWTLEYCHRKLNKEGVVTSDSDELEGRFPSGDANLCTSSLYYDALLSAVYLGKSLGKSSAQLNVYAKEAQALRKSIDKYFGGTVEGFNTYHYYKGNDVLRSWICIPLTVGIYDRKEATINALFSPRLWTENGLLTQAGTETYWDRSTLYGFRGVIACGEVDKAMDYLKFYSNRRLLGEHVPYAIEAWPEGSQRHLSAESGLYCRIFTEGLFGIRPTGFHSFDLTPRLPKEWNEMSLNQICAFGKVFDIQVQRMQNKLDVRILSGGKLIKRVKIKDGATIKVSI